jgi:hypothetical protein
MDKKHKAKGGLPSKGWDQTGARIERKEETMPKVTKSSTREKKGAEHLTNHPHSFFLGQMTTGKRGVSQNTEKPKHMIGFPIFQGDLL